MVVSAVFAFAKKAKRFRVSLLTYHTPSSHKRGTKDEQRRLYLFMTASYTGGFETQQGLALLLLNVRTRH